MRGKKDGDKLRPIINTFVKYDILLYKYLFKCVIVLHRYLYILHNYNIQ